MTDLSLDSTIDAVLVGVTAAAVGGEALIIKYYFPLSADLY